MGPPLIILLLALTVATWTDVTQRKIFNWTTYPTILLCVIAAGWSEGWSGVATSLVGCLVCGGLMLGAYLCLDVGGGDVKLAAAMGAGLGWIQGLYALLWTFSLAGVLALAVIIWRVGAWNLVKRCFGRRSDERVTGDDAATVDRQLHQPLFLAPAALAAVLIVISPALN